MPIALLVLLAAAGGIYALSPKRTTLHKGQARICFDKSSPENRSKLAVLFDGVVDEGGGCYTVTVAETSGFNLPEGARVGACRLARVADARMQGEEIVSHAARRLIAMRAMERIGSNDYFRARRSIFGAARKLARLGAVTSSIELYSVFLEGKHVGFAFGLGPARAMAYSYRGLTFKKSAQKWPAKWSPAFIPVWGDRDHRTTWGRFLYPYNLAITDAMRKHYEAFTEYQKGSTPFQLADNYVSPYQLASR